MADGDFERVVDVDLLGVWRTVRATLPSVIEARGHVVVTASIYAYVNGLVNAPYAASKAGVEQLARAPRAELAPYGASAGVPQIVERRASVVSGHRQGRTPSCASGRSETVASCPTPSRC